MAGGKGSHGTRRFLHRLRMKNVLGIRSSREMRSNSRMRGRDRRRGTWWDRKQNRVAIEGVDFAQDTQEGGTDQFELIPDSDEQEGDRVSSVADDADEFVPETEPQDRIEVSSIGGPCAIQGHRRFGTMLQKWFEIILDREIEASREIQLEEVKDLQSCSKEDTKQKWTAPEIELEEVRDLQTCSKEVTKQNYSAKEGMQHKNYAKEDLVDHKASFSDLSTDDEASWFEDDDDFN